MKLPIDHLTKGEVLARLYNNAKPKGLGYLQGDQMTEVEGQALYDEQGPYFDYLNGRVIKCDLSGDVLNTTLYDRDNDPAKDAILPGIDSIVNDLDEIPFNAEMVCVAVPSGDEVTRYDYHPLTVAKYLALRYTLNVEALNRL